MSNRDRVGLGKIHNEVTVPTRVANGDTITAYRAPANGSEIYAVWITSTGIVDITVQISIGPDISVKNGPTFTLPANSGNAVGVPPLSAFAYPLALLNDLEIGQLKYDGDRVIFLEGGEQLAFYIVDTAGTQPNLATTVRGFDYF